MRNISFFYTHEQVRNSRPDNILKDITRRNGWWNVKPGERLMGCLKCQGIKPGESIEKIRVIEVVSAKREHLAAMIYDPKYGKAECIREGFPHLDGRQFVEMFCQHIKKMTPGSVVNRIEFRYIWTAPMQDEIWRDDPVMFKQTVLGTFSNP